MRAMCGQKDVDRKSTEEQIAVWIWLLLELKVQESGNITCTVHWQDTKASLLQCQQV